MWTSPPTLAWNLVGHTDAVWSVAFATQSDGTLLLATSSADSTVRLWNPVTGEHLHTLIGHTGEVRSVAFGTRSNGTLILATASFDDTARLWDPITGEHLHTLTGHTGRVRSVAFATLADGTLLLATASYDRTTRLWNPATGEHLHTLVGHPGDVYAVAFAAQPDGTPLLATGGNDRTTRLWNPATGQHLHTLTGHTDYVRSIAFATQPDGTLILATGGNDHTTRLWNPATGQHLHTFSGHTGYVRSVVFTTQADGTLILATASADQTTRLWNPATGQQLHSLNHHRGVNGVAFAPGRPFFATGCDDHTARVWSGEAAPETQPARELKPSDVEVTRDPRRLVGHTNNVHAVALATQADGTLVLATAGGDHTARLWNPTTGIHLHTLTGHTSIVNSVAFATQPDGTPILATAADDDTARLWNPVTGIHLHTLTGHTSIVNSVAFATQPDGTLILATASSDNTARLWNPATGEYLRTLTGHTDTVWSVAFGTMPDGTLILATASDDTAQLWDPATGEHLRTLTGHTSEVRSVAFAAQADGTLILATAGNDLTTRLWDPTTGDHIHTLTGHTGAVNSVTFGALPDGTLILATASDDQTARIWNPATGDHLHTFVGHAVLLLSVALCGISGDTLLLATDCGAADDTNAFGLADEPGLWRIKVRSTPAAQTQSDPQLHHTNARALRAACHGLVILSTVDIVPPLGLLLDLTALTGGADPPEYLAALAHHAGIERLRALGWPEAARVGLAALLLEGIAFEAAYLPPNDDRRSLLIALRSAIAARSGPRVVPSTPTAAILANAERITDRTVAMLEVLGSDAVAVDPLLPLRLRDQAEAMPPIREQIRAAIARLRRDTNESVDVRVESADTAGGVVGVSRHGTMTGLVHTQLALTENLFALRYASGDLLFRLRHRPSKPLLEDLTIVLDTSPPTFGPIETVLRLVAHCIIVTLWRGNGRPHLVTTCVPSRVLCINQPADLATIWTERSLYPPRLAEAIETAEHATPGKVVTLTTHQLARDYPLVGTSTRRVITTTASDVRTQRAAATRYQVHLQPQPSAADIARAVSIVLAQDR